MSKSDIITGQYVRIQQTAASLGDRIVARLIDYLLLFAYVSSMVMLVATMKDQWSDLKETILVWLVFLPTVFYSFLCETFFHGQTLGKRLRHIRVVNVNGSQPTMGALLLRWMCLVIDVWTSGVGIVAIMLTKRRQRLGDLAAATMVIHLDDYKQWHGTLDDFYYLKADYRPVFRQAADLSDGQAHVIERTLYAPGGYDPVQLSKLAGKVRSFLHHDALPAGMTDADYLATVLRDYQYFELELV